MLDGCPECRQYGEMIVDVLNVGTELLLGEVTNTHAGWIAKQIFPLGLRIARQTTVPDGAAIREGILESFNRADVLFITGGLGPTTDDITREVAAELLGMQLIADEEIRRRIEERLAARGYKMLDRMLRQTMVPEGATVLLNNHGTAPGLYIPSVSYPSSASPHMFLLPGPPRELQPMFRDAVLPILRKICSDLSPRDCRTYRVVGLGESAVEEMVGLKLTSNPDLEVGYCARPNEVDFRLIGSAEALDAVEPEIISVLGDYLVSASGEALEEWVVSKLTELNQTVTTAESCTGGLLASRITDFPGSSAIFKEGWVTYSNEAKISALGVSPELLAKHGAVSEPVSRAMAEGARLKAGANYALALTGIAGPGGGTKEKPVGLVFISLAREGKETLCGEFRFATDRATFKQRATQSALDMLRRELLVVSK